MSALARPVGRELLETAVAAISASTRRAYAGAWAQWRTFAGSRGAASLPADLLLVAAWVRDRYTTGLAPSTLRIGLAALG